MTEPDKSSNGVEVVWSPLPGSQTIALDSRCDHTLYEGARGPGKSVVQLMRFAKRVGMGYGSFWRGVIFDLEFDNLSGLVTETKKWFKKLGGTFYASTSAYKWVWPTGEELLFRHVKKVSDYEGFHGHEYPYVGWNELTKYPTSDLYDKFMSVNRSSFDPETNTPTNEDGSYATPDGKPLPPIPLEVFSTTNPNGPGHNWVKRRFIDVAERGEVVKRDTEIFNPQTQQNEIVTRTQVTIFGSYRENKFLPPGYIAELESIKEPNLRKAWLFGDWDVTSGGALDDLWNRSIHVVPRFVIPLGWNINRSFDWGSTHPFSVGWWAEANGEEATIVKNGVEYSFCPPAGTLVQFFEWYGAAEIGTNKGMKLSAFDVAEGIRNREISLVANGWIHSLPRSGPADNQIRDVRETDVPTIEQKMLELGIEWTPSDKSPGSRKIGLQAIRDRLEAATRKEEPALYFMENCKASIETIPYLPRDETKPDDVDSNAEDHCYDMVRYRVLSGSFAAGKLNMTIVH